MAVQTETPVYDVCKIQTDIDEIKIYIYDEVQNRKAGALKNDSIKEKPGSTENSGEIYLQLLLKNYESRVASMEKQLDEKQTIIE